MKLISTEQPKRERPCILFLPCYREQKMLDGVAQFAREANWILDVLFYYTGKLPDTWEGDGIISMSHVSARSTSINEFVKNHRHLPIVDLSLNDTSIQIPRVLLDNEAVGRLGAEHLVSRGCRRLGFVMHRPNAIHDGRLRGFSSAAAALGYDVELIHVNDTNIHARNNPNWFTQHMPHDARPFGIMAAADHLAQWVVQACQQTGCRIPENVSVLGVDNCLEICELSTIGISSIDTNAFQHGYRAAALLQDIMQGHPAPSEPIMVPAGALHVRASTDILATRHPHVAAALKHIDAHFTDRELTPTRVAKTIPMSHRRLHDAFVRHVGRTMQEEIVHRRLQHALQQVQGSQEKLWVIAEASGFSSPEAMSRLFTRKLGKAPSSFR